MPRPDRSPPVRRRRRRWPLLALLVAAAATWWWFAGWFTDWFVAGHGLPPTTPVAPTSTSSSTPPAPVGPVAIVGRTGPPQLAHDDGVALNIVPLSIRDRGALQLPETSPEARIGRLEIAGKTVDCLIDHRGDHHYFIYDENANKDLRDDPRRALAHRAGEWELEIPGELPLRIRTRGPLVYAQQRVVRHGELPLAGERLLFALIGSSGDYAYSFHRVAIDLDRDGQLMIGDDDGPEVFYVSEKTVNLDDRSYTMIVDPHGETLGLAQLPERLPDRPSLRSGTPAAPFSARDLDGNTVEFPRGRPTLLDFWSYTCHYCKESLPQLDALAAQFPDLDILIIADSDADSARPDLSTLTARPNLVRLVDARNVHTLYRVHGVPRYHLVDRTGTLTCVRCSLDHIREVIPTVLAR